jgi:hypothetical protein
MKTREECEVGTTDEALAALRKLGAALLARETTDHALEAYERKIYPEGKTVSQMLALEKDPEWMRLYRTVKRAETAEWACTQTVLRLAKRIVKKERIEAKK